MPFNTSKKNRLSLSTNHQNKYDEKAMQTLQFLPSHQSIVFVSKPTNALYLQHAEQNNHHDSRHRRPIRHHDDGP